ncbi:MAG: glycosyltransferase [Verrucomicrobia bacterium]|nr:glycosyltransferase [Verrucomicrobiota bacterium]
MRILWVKTGPLHPIDTGGKRRTHAMLTEISREHEVTYLSLLPDGTVLDDKEADDDYAAHKIWISTRIAPKWTFQFWFDLIRSTIFSSKPYALEKYEVLPMRKKLQEMSATGGFDLVICDFLAPALNFVGLRFSAPAVLFQHNIESQIWKRLALSQTSVLKSWYFRIQYLRMKKWEAKLSALFDGVITVSSEDSEIARAEYGLTNVLGHVPTGVDVATFRPSVQGNSDRPFTIGFLGSMDWRPNVDACLYFVREILPRVWEMLPQSRLKIIGRNPPSSLHNLASIDARIEVTGTVDDVQPYVHQCHVIAVPLMAGGGTRIKIYEAMAMGVPVVSTTIGAEGLAVTHGEDILLADGSADFSAALVKLEGDPELSSKLAVKAREQMELCHSWAAATRCFMKLCMLRLSSTST